MAVYKVDELFEQIRRLANEKYEYVNVEIFPAGNGYPESISITAIEEANMGVDLESLEAVNLPDGYVRPYLGNL